MHNIDVIARTNGLNPRQATLTVPQFDTVAEAIKTCGRTHVLQLINHHSVQKARADWNTRYTKELYQGTKDEQTVLRGNKVRKKVATNSR